MIYLLVIANIVLFLFFLLIHLLFSSDLTIIVSAIFITIIFIGIIAIPFFNVEVPVRKKYPFIFSHFSRPYRSLSSQEKNELTEVILSNSNMNYYHLQLWELSGILLVSQLIMWMSYLLLIKSEGLGESEIKWLLQAFTLVAVVYVFYRVFRNSKLDHDLNSPVHIIQGKLMRPKYPGKESYDYKVGLYKFKFKTTHSHAGKQLIHIRNNDRVTLEFSPKSKFVWKIEKV